MMTSKTVVITYVCQDCKDSCTILAIDMVRGDGDYAYEEGSTKSMHCVYNGEEKEMTIASIEEIVSHE